MAHPQPPQVHRGGGVDHDQTMTGAVCATLQHIYVRRHFFAWLATPIAATTMTAPTARRRRLRDDRGHKACACDEKRALRQRPRL